MNLAMLITQNCVSVLCYPPTSVLVLQGFKEIPTPERLLTVLFTPSKYEAHRSLRDFIITIRLMVE
jgi:hypothetical protein